MSGLKLATVMTRLGLRPATVTAGELEDVVGESEEAETDRIEPPSLDPLVFGPGPS